MKEIQKLKLEELNRIDIPEFKAASKIPVVIILDNIRSGLNVGSIFRTCDAFLIERIYLCGITATPPHKEILKTAIGANNSVEWEYRQTVIEVVAELKESKYQLIGIEQTNASVPLQHFHVSEEKHYAIVFGNEVDGIREDILDEIDLFIEIPQFGTKHSLNVAVCAGIVIHYFAGKYLWAK